MDLIKGIKTRRSVRKFQDKAVPHDVLEQIINVAAYAPTWKNTQINRYIAIEGREKIDYIAKEFASFNIKTLSNAPLLIAQTFVKNRSGFERDGSYTTDRREGWQMYDCGIGAQTLALAAHEAGLGTVIMGIFDRLALQEYLQIPEDQELIALIAIGYPDEEPVAPRRKGADVILSYAN